jgi:hypothetical protein
MYILSIFYSKSSRISNTYYQTYGKKFSMFIMQLHVIIQRFILFDFSSFLFKGINTDVIVLHIWNVNIPILLPVGLKINFLNWFIHQDRYHNIFKKSMIQRKIRIIFNHHHQLRIIRIYFLNQNDMVVRIVH